MRVSAAPGRKVGAVHAGRLNQTLSGQRLTLPEPQGFTAKPLLHGTEAFDAYALLHLAEVGFSRHSLAVAAGRPHLPVSSEPLDQVFDVRYLLQLTQHQSPQVTLRIILHRSPCALNVQTLPKDGADRT